MKTSANSAYSTPISIICHCAKPVVKITTTSSGDPKLTLEHCHRRVQV